MMQKIEISHRTIIFTTVFLISIWFLIQIRDILLLLFISLILMSTLNPLVNRLQRLKIPRGIAIILIYFVVLGILAGSFASLIIPLVEQTTLFFNRIPLYLEQLGLHQLEQSMIINQLGSIPQNFLRLIVEAVSNVIGVLTVAVFTFYLLLERKKLSHHLAVFLGEINAQKGEALVNLIENQLGYWIRGQIILSLIIGIITYVGLIILGIDYALPLALISGLLEIIPNIGPIVATFPAVLVAFTASPLMGVAVIALYFLTQQLENLLIVPGVMKRTVGLNPLITLLSLMIGFKVAGVVGAVLAIPTALVLIIVLKEIYSSKKFQNSET